MSLLRTILIGRNPRRTLVRMAVTVVVCTVVFKYMFRPALVNGESMEPTVPDRGLRFINLLAYRGEDPQRGDIVAVRMAGKDMFYLKRVLGLPGETVELRDGVLLINQREVNESYLAYRGSWTMKPHTLGEDEYWVAGDNRSMPMANHKQGTTHRRFICGRLL